MGQCMSRKAAGAFAASAAAAHNRPSKMKKREYCQSPNEENNKDESRKQSTVYSKGVAMSFGFRRRPQTAPSIASNSNAARRLANADILDRNGNGNSDTEPLTSNIAPSGRSTPRLMPPKKEATATRINRFGFRQPQNNRLNKVTNLNSPPGEFCNNNIIPRPRQNAQQNKVRCNIVRVDNNKNKMTRFGSMDTQAERYTLQSNQLPGPQPVRLIETKTAKTIANNSKKIASGFHEDNSSKDGSLTEDSGVSSSISGGISDIAMIREVEHLDNSPTYGVRRNSQQKPRNLEVVLTGNTFDVRDLDDCADNCTPLPQLPSAFNNMVDNKRSAYQNNGFVRERTLDYQRHLELDNRRKISITSSEGFSDDYGEEEKTYIDRFKSEKTFIKPTMHKTFIKPRGIIKDDSSPPSSDEQEWTHGGEAMADELSVSISSSDESKEKEQLPIRLNDLKMSNQFIKSDLKNVLLKIEDTQFAAVAASSNTLLDDETSPVDSLISYTESDEILKRKFKNKSSSESKDINEKLTPSTPGTPTNASNSLSLSDGKDDFLIDDEIADQPALVFEDTITPGNNDNYNSISQNNSENTPTIVDSTPKLKRRSFISVDGSPLPIRTRKFLHSRTGSLDTLSPCESIASDDLMMDFDYSQSSGLDDLDRTDKLNNSDYPSLDETIVNLDKDNNRNDKLRDWSALLGNYTSEKLIKNNNATRTRLLRSRTSTPTSVPDSPKSLEGKLPKPRPSANNSPLRLARPGHLSSTGYESDESIRLDRSNHTAMKQDIISMKTMLLKLRRVLNEQTDEDMLMRSETHMPFDNQLTLTNGLFNGLSSNNNEAQNQQDYEDDNKLELAELRRQVLFLQGQLEDKDKTVSNLQEQVIRLANENYNSNSAPASTSVHCDNSMCNAATQTERIRPISAGPSLLNGSSVDGNVGSLVSANNDQQTSRRSRPPLQTDSPSSARRTPSRLWRKPGEPPSPQRYTNHSSSIPRRANSRTRMPSTPS